MASLRWRRVLPASVLSMTGYGMYVYGASTFIAPVSDQAPDLPLSTIPYAFALRSTIFAVFNLSFGASMLQRVPPWRSAVVACTLIILGCACAGGSVALSSPTPGLPELGQPLIFASFVICGIASAVFYLPVYTPCLAWFPDRKGIVAGCIGVGQAVGGMTWNATGPLISQHLAASTVFVLYGVLVAACWSAGLLIQWPPSGQTGPPPANHGADGPDWLRTLML